MIDSTAFTSEAELRHLNATIAGFGLRTTASPAHRRLVDWLEGQVRRNPGITTRSETSRITRWLPITGDLASTGLLFADGHPVPIAGAIPYSKPTLYSSGELVHLRDPITAANARGKVVIRDFPAVDRGYLAEAALDRDLVAAAQAGAAGLIVAFDFPRSQVKGYYDPHTGTHYGVPGVFVGGAEAQALKNMAGRRANLAVLAVTGQATTRSVIATLPGRSKEKIVFDANTDGNTWVQENANAGLLALAKYFSHQPSRCRPRTIEFVFATGHLHRPAEGTELYARKLDAEYDNGTVAFAFALEHLGTREYVRVGQTLRPTGLSETFGWFAGSPVLAAAAENAIARHGLDRVFVLPGIDLPVPGRVPPQCSFGGLGTHFHSHLVPTMAVISGPWSLWAPSFGEAAIDFARMRAQVLAAGDTVLALADVPRSEIAGPYPGYRQARAAGAPTCSHELPPEH
ncbi:hypothetical protein KIPE111705_03315 [Kibdelosporangium persicum]|uniref:PA domain-containing protein n=1 Tax=Kibdelosporangium persicum TaxID=2698649 RepID=A0ABX2F922_9PSEU|nr:PA domain-containing protein [Kibdelosporangium persicum]